MKLTLDTDKQVFFYEQDFYVLSNFSAFNVNVFGRDFQTAEHAYHWRKFSNVMQQIIKAKAEQHEYVRRKLLSTGSRELIENSWRDDFWGWGESRTGKNMLGKLWMELREDLRNYESAISKRQCTPSRPKQLCADSPGD